MIMTKPFILLALLLLNACASKENHFEIDPAFQSHYDSFIREANTRGKLQNVDDLIMKFMDDLGANSSGATILAQCKTSSGGTPTVEVDASKWGGLGNCQKYALIYHELGHCLLNREHKNGLDGSGSPVSFMHDTLVSESDCSTKNAEYINEMFN